MTYLFFSDTYTPRPDGVAHSVAWTSQTLRDLGKDVMVVHPRLSDNPQINPFEIALPSIKPLRRDYRTSLLAYVAPVNGWFAKKISNLQEIDIIHVHSLGPIGMLGLRFAWANSIPVVLSWHTDLISYAKIYPDVYLGALAGVSQLMTCSPNREKLAADWSIMGILRKLLQSVDHVVVPSVKTAAHVRNLNMDADISMIPTGLPKYMATHEGLPRSYVRAKLGLDSNHQLILAVGRISAEKNPALLRSSLIALRAACPQVRCMIVGSTGSGPRGRHYEALLRADDALVTAPVPHKQLLDLYRAADLLLVPSLTETQGLTIIEAQFLGLPIVCADPALAMLGTRRIPGVWAADSPTSEAMSVTSAQVLSRRTKPAPTQPSFAKDILYSSEAQAQELLKLYERLN